MEYSLHAKAHGKILWLGGYSILEKQNVGYVTSVDAGTHVYLKGLENDEIRVIAEDFGADVRGKLDRGSGRLDIKVPQELKLVKTAVQAVLYHALNEGATLSGFEIKTKNDPAFSYRISSDGKAVSKSGLGSSAAVTVAAIGALMEHFGLEFNKDDALHKLAQISHSVATGKIGSGFDIASAVYGDIIYSRYSPEIVKEFPQEFDKEDVSSAIKRKWDYSIEPMKLPENLKFAVADFVGAAAITTTMVGSVNMFKKSAPEEYYKLINAMNNENVKAIESLKNINKGKNIEDNLENFKQSFNAGRRLAKTLGERSNVPIETDEITDLIEKTVEKGAFVAKSPGSGGYDSIAALFLVKDDSAYRNVVDFWSNDHRLRPFQLERNSNGLEINRDRQKLVF
ncbi:MAG: hypothetical protein QXK65_02210 [Candidatus Micrarchaeaceae archaeon]